MSQENRRVQMTKRLITDAMTELCERGEPVAKISVSELCAIAEVNRSTFYKYYDGPEDLFGEIENSALLWYPTSTRISLRVCARCAVTFRRTSA